MQKMQIKLAVLTLAAMLLMYSGCSVAKEPSKSSGNAAPDFTLKKINGEEVTLSSALKRKKVVLDFWATWCRYCVTTAPQLERFYQKNKKKIAVFGINVQESKQKVKAFTEKMGLSYPMLLDADGEVANSYNVRGIPTIIAIDRNGTILYHGHSIKEMENKVDF